MHARWIVPFTALAACASPPSATDAGGGVDASLTDSPLVDDVPVDRPRAPDVERAMSESEQLVRRRACAYTAGQFAASTVGREVPLGSAIPIDHVLVVMMENRSFDHYFSQLVARGHRDVEVPPAGWSNPRADGTPVRPFRDSRFCIEDVAHSWVASFRQWNNGRNDGFVTTNDPMGERAMGYMDEPDLPFYYALARTFAMGDRYFSSVMGPTWPNRFYLLAATSFGISHNTAYFADTANNPARHILQVMDDYGVTWRDYAGDLRLPALFPYYGIIRTTTREHYRNHAALMDDLRTGSLPQFAFVEPAYNGNGATRQDEHPPGTPQAGERFVEGVVRALMASPAWGRTALFILYDEHGGFADHVSPPEACAPDGHPAVDERGNPRADGSFRRYGFRVPFMVVSPYARRGFVSHQVYDHGSILRFVEARFGLPALTARDANATPPLEMFDFANPPHRTPPTLPRGGWTDAVQERCGREFPRSPL